MLLYRCSDDLEVVGYTDSDFGTFLDDRKSTSRFVFMLTGGAISWKSVKQTLTTSSAMQAEFVACYGAITQAIWLKNFISGLKIVDFICRPLRIYYDDNIAVMFSKNNKSSSGSKHIKIKYLVVRDFMQKRDVEIEHIRTDAIIADSLTKGLPLRIFQSHLLTWGW